jgi:hypothetical protein
MLHACFYTICLVFRYTSWHFYTISGTNLLTSHHSASSLFSAIFVFQKSYTGNILRIGRNKSRTSKNSPKLPENRTDACVDITVLFSIYELGDCNSTLFVEFQSILDDEEEPMVIFYFCMLEN